MRLAGAGERATMPRAGRTVAALAIGAWLLAPFVHVGAQTCDPAIPRNDSLTSGYRPRGDWCEGVYQRLVASSGGIKLVSLTAASDLDNLCVPGQPLHLTWATPAPASGPVRIRAESLRQRLYYRLDLDRPSSASSFEWPPAPRCNNDVRLTASEWGILAQVPSTVDARVADVLLPVSLSRTSSTGSRLPYRAVLVPGRRLNEIYVSLWRQGTNGSPARRVFFERPLGRSPYLPGTPVAVPLSSADVTEPGVYRATVSAQSDSGTPEALEFLFFHGR
jgi:hypothetical protein